MTEKTEKRVADTINIVTYVANDGTEFVSKDSCLAYEKKLKDIEAREKEIERKLIEEPFNKLFKIIYNATGFVWYTDIFVGVLKSKADYELVKKYIDLNGYEDYTEEPKQYPSPYVFCIGESGDAYTEHMTAEPHEWIQEYIDALAEVRAEMEKEQSGK